MKEPTAEGVESGVCGNCKHLGESCEGPYGYDNTCEEWEKK